MHRFIKFITGIVVLGVGSMQYAVAQCAMCRATVENNVSAGDTGLASGLNVGILYLMSMPYLAAVVIGIAWYRYTRRQAAERRRIADILRSRLS